MVFSVSAGAAKLRINAPDHVTSCTQDTSPFGIPCSKVSMGVNVTDSKVVFTVQEVQKLKRLDGLKIASIRPEMERFSFQ